MQTPTTFEPVQTPAPTPVLTTIEPPAAIVGADGGGQQWTGNSGDGSGSGSEVYIENTSGGGDGSAAGSGFESQTTTPISWCYLQVGVVEINSYM